MRLLRAQTNEHCTRQANTIHTNDLEKIPNKVVRFTWPWDVQGSHGLAYGVDM